VYHGIRVARKVKEGDGKKKTTLGSGGSREVNKHHKMRDDNARGAPPLGPHQKL